MMLSKNQMQKLIQIAEEDIGSGDVTTSLVKEKKVFAQITVRENCVLAGVEEAVFLFKKNQIKIVRQKKDGEFVKKGVVVLRVFGSNKKILGIERTVLNFLGRMSGVATLCKKASGIAGKKTSVFLTRKTMPGLNEFDKKACLFGGVNPHRKNLSDAILVKDNHLVHEGIPEILKKAVEKKSALGLKEIEIEVQNQIEAIKAAKSYADVILLDNFSQKNAEKTIQKIRQFNKKVLIELSGGINLKNLQQYSSLGADRISMGTLTRDARMLDFSLEILK